MKRIDLIRSIAVQFDRLGSMNAADITDAVFDYLQERVAAGDRVELRGFGVFLPRARMTKIGYNPRTGARNAIPAGRCVKFRPSSALIKGINGWETERISSQ
jgi:DNA-binding protein HU-beta